MGEFLIKPVVGEFVSFSKKCERIVAVSATQFRTDNRTFRRNGRTGEYTTGSDFGRSWAFIPTPEQISRVVAEEKEAADRKAAFTAKAVLARDLLTRVDWSKINDGNVIYIAKNIGLIEE